MSQDVRNLIIAVALSTIVLMGWQFFYENPKQKEIQQFIEKEVAEDKKNSENLLISPLTPAPMIQESNLNVPNIKVVTENLHGSISLRGLRFDELYLSKYRESTNASSKNVVLFSKSDPSNTYLAEFGWRNSGDDETALPTKATIWSSDKEVLREGKKINLSWDNGNGVVFKTIISLDNNYMFTIQQTVENFSNKTLTIIPYGLIFRTLSHSEKPAMVFHEGAIGAFDSILEEMTYEDLLKKNRVTYNSQKGGWIGFTDKYWLSAIVPRNDSGFEASFYGNKLENSQTYQIDYVGSSTLIKHGEAYSVSSNLFAGAKVANLLNEYQEKYDIQLFDRAIDYGWFYFLTKPMFFVLNYIYMFCNNFGVAILLITILIKALMFPIANKSFITMQKMKKLQPLIIQIKEQYAGDQIKLNSEMMSLYKKENLSPMSGCLPILIQIPVFFSLYKVIFISIEMRHAQFFGWIKDLSAPDPTSIFNLFGLLPFNAPLTFSIAAWPLIMGITMLLQQKMSPPPADPIQAKVMKFLPLIFIFMFQSFPAGLMIYWSWSNVLSIAQQWVIDRRAKIAE